MGNLERNDESPGVNPGAEYIPSDQPDDPEDLAAGEAEMRKIYPVFDLSTDPAEDILSGDFGEETEVLLEELTEEE